MLLVGDHLDLCFFISGGDHQSAILMVLIKLRSEHRCSVRYLALIVCKRNGQDVRDTNTN